MKYYSEKLDKVFNTENECVQAEKEHENKAQKREQRAKEVEQAFKEAQEANVKANELLNAFIKDYGSFHSTQRDIVESLWDNLFNFLK